MKLTHSLPAAALAVSLVAIPALAQDQSGPAKADLVKPVVTFEEAVETARANAEGDIIMMHFDYLSETKPLYAAQFESETGTTMLMIDAVTGKLIASDTFKAADAETYEALMQDGFGMDDCSADFEPFLEDDMPDEPK